MFNRLINPKIDNLPLVSEHSPIGYSIQILCYSFAYTLYICQITQTIPHLRREITLRYLGNLIKHVPFLKIPVSPAYLNIGFTVYKARTMPK